MQQKNLVFSSLSNTKQHTTDAHNMHGFLSFFKIALVYNIGKTKINVNDRKRLTFALDQGDREILATKWLTGIFLEKGTVLHVVVVKQIVHFFQFFQLYT